MAGIIPIRGFAKSMHTRLFFYYLIHVYVCFLCVCLQGMSGRSLRKLPIKAHSYYVQRPVVTAMEFLCAMHAVIVGERANTET